MILQVIYIIILLIGLNMVIINLIDFFLINIIKMEYNNIYKRFCFRQKAVNSSDSPDMNINNTSVQDFRYVASQTCIISELIIYGEDSGNIDSGYFLNKITLNNGFRIYYKKNNSDNKSYLTDPMTTSNNIMLFADCFNLRSFGSGNESISFCFKFHVPINLIDGEIGLELGVDNYSKAEKFHLLIKGYTLV